MSTLDEVFAVGQFMADFPGVWWVAGGWSVDILAGGASREHSDIEFGLFQADQATFYDYCAGWDLDTPREEEWVPMQKGEMLAFPEFQLRLMPTKDAVRRADDLPHEFEFMLNYVEDGQWLFRPEPSIRLSLDRLVHISPLGLRVVAPEAILLHKSRYHRPKDDHDFARALPLMLPQQRSWLAEAIRQIRPDDMWLEALEGCQS